MQAENLLIEIGCEDLPSWSGEHFISRFRPLFIDELSNYKLSAHDILFFFTPRRFVIFVKGLPSKIAPERKEITGPRYEDAFDKDGRPTIAACGFAKAHGVPVSSLRVKNINGKRVVFVIKTIPGIATKGIIPDILIRILRKIDIPKGMRWNESQEVFYRPVRWILAMFESRSLAVNFGGVKSSGYTYGHRILCPNKIKIFNWKDYFDKIQNSFVLLDKDLRQQFILKLIKASLKKNENFEESVIDDVVNLIEYPRVIRCNFPSVDCNLPQEVLRVLILKAKGIPIFVDGQLQKEFFVVSDGNDNKDVRVNYENLLRTRILDAQFFYDSDISVPFDEFKEKLNRIIFHQKWGSVAKRVERLKMLAFDVSEMVGLDAEQKKTLIRAAEICKYDLASEMVREFPDLHGIMGAMYAKLSG
ncbi:MAG: glycine--tRNA ligase subunit beta, partial [Candidatus Ratteibacteria bacterium]